LAFLLSCAHFGAERGCLKKLKEAGAKEVAALSAALVV